jgi:hypothetical protein
MISLTIIGKIVEDLKCSGKSHIQIARDLSVSVEFVYDLMLMYYGVNDSALKSFKIDFRGDEVDIGQYLNNNLTIVERNNHFLVI